MKGRKTGGRHKGTPNKTTTETASFCASVVDDPAYQASVRARALSGELAPAVETMLWHYAKGKPKELVVHSGEIRLPQVIDELHAG